MRTADCIANYNYFILQSERKSVILVALKRKGIFMENFPKYYAHLFNSITYAIDALQRQNYIEAQDILIRAQQDAEEMYLADGDGEDL